MDNANRGNVVPERGCDEGQQPFGGVHAAEDVLVGLGDDRKDPYDDLMDVCLNVVDPVNGLREGETAEARPGSAAGRSGHERDGSALLGASEEGKRVQRHGGVQRMRTFFRYVVPRGGALACCFNLVATSLGAGIIALPSSFNLSGVLMATVYLVLVAIATIYALHLIGRVVEITGFCTYSEAAMGLLGRGADYLLAILLLILCFGGSVSYIIAMSTLMDPVLKYPSSPAFLKTKQGNQVVVSAMWLGLMVPLILPKEINSLRYVALVGITFIFYFVICIVVHSTQNGLRNPEVRQQMIVVRTGNAALQGLGTFLFAYLSQINGFELYREMARPSPARFTLYSIISMAFLGVIYFLAGFFGYADFGSAVTDSILRLYDPVKEPYILVGYVGIVMQICVAFAMHFHPLRDAGYYLLGWNVKTIPYWRHCLVIMVPATLALICGLFIPTLNTVLGLLGSLCGGTIGMIMPALFIMYCGHFTYREVGGLQYVGTFLLLIGGVVAVVFGTATTIYSTAGSSF